MPVRLLTFQYGMGMSALKKHNQYWLLSRNRMHWSNTVSLGGMSRSGKTIHKLTHSGLVQDKPGWGLWELCDIILLMHDCECIRVVLQHKVFAINVECTKLAECFRHHCKYQSVVACPNAHTHNRALKVCIKWVVYKWTLFPQKNEDNPKVVSFCTDARWAHKCIACVYLLQWRLVNVHVESLS